MWFNQPYERFEKSVQLKTLSDPSLEFGVSSFMYNLKSNFRKENILPVYFAVFCGVKVLVAT